MDKDLKVAAFVFFSSIGIVSFVAKFIETGSSIKSLGFALQMYGLMLGIIVMVVVLLYIGNKIFHD